ncbi:MAG: FecCD family ABC transporter permease [Acidimicrobiia bacterium]
MVEERRRRWVVIYAALTASLVLSIAVAVGIGPVAVPTSTVWRIIGYRAFSIGERGDWSRSQEFIVWNLRLPRVLLGASVGAGLAVTGAVLQALVRNPLADPYVFGITSGASVGASLVLVIGIAAFGSYSLSGAAFIGATVAFALVLALARSPDGLLPTRLILSGVAVSYAMSSLTSLLVFTAANQGDQGAALSVVFWILGGLGGARWNQVLIPVIAVACVTAVLSLQARALNAISIGDESAATLGIDLRTFRRLLFTACSLLTGLIVAVSGGIGFVGLIVPHAIRIAVGPDHRRLLPLSVLVGAIFLVWADVGARVLFAPSELPIGVITAMVGTPVFVILLRTQGSSGHRR